MTAPAAVDMWKAVLMEYGLPAEGGLVAEADCMWTEILKEKGLPMDTLFRRPRVPLRLKSRIEEEVWVGRQRKLLGDVGYEEMNAKKAECFKKLTRAEYEMKNILEKAAKKKKKMLKKAGKNLEDDQEALGLLYDNKKKWLTRCTTNEELLLKKEQKKWLKICTTNGMILKKEAEKKWLTRCTTNEKTKKILEELQGPLGLLYDKKKKKKKKKNKRKRHGDDDDDDSQNKKKMKKATTTSSGS